MLRIVLLMVGAILLIVQHYTQPLSVQLQFIIFLSGIVVLGIPHGAVDLLVATQSSASQKKSFSAGSFFANYIGRAILFSIIFWFSPLAGILLFIFFAAYHFGETDLCEFKTNTFSGKFFVSSYGLVILAVILVHHFEEVKPILMQFNAGIKHESFIRYIGQHRYTILSCSGILFFISTFFYFLTNTNTEQQQGLFLVQFAAILFMLYNLPMILGFTFYFILWHSVLSLRNIIKYLQKDGLFSTSVILKQLAFYSILAIIGIGLFGFASFMFISNNSMMVCIFVGLAVLTVPHMEVMHDMYNGVRGKSIVL
jgi:beta-carotene 15,15'-dioxygenase